METKEKTDLIDNLVLRLEKCIKGNHPLVTVSEAGLGPISMDMVEDDAITNWCPVCGSIVVDSGADGRSNNPGGVMRMKSPDITKLLAAAVNPKKQPA
jgi:hypothetical protein